MSMPRYPAYKETGIEWLGTVPEHWRVERFKLSVESCTNGVWGEEANNNSNDVVCIRVADFDRQKLQAAVPEEPTIRNVSDRDIETRGLRCGDLLIEKSGGGEKQPVGAVVLFTGSTLAVCSNFVARMRLAPGMTPSFWRYTHHAAYSLRVTTKSIKQTSGIQNLDQQQYLDEVAAYPPSDEQEEIANFLDRETAKIDALIAEQQRLIELLQEKRQAVISHAVTKGLNPNAPMKDSGLEWLGEVPKHWEVAQIRRYIQKDRKITYGIVQPGEPDPNGRFMVRGQDYSNGWVSPDSIFRVSPTVEEPYSRSRLLPNDLVMTIVGAGIGNTAKVPDWLDGANLTQTTCRLAVDPGLMSADFTRLVLESHLGRHSVGFYAKGAAQPGLNLEHVKMFFVTCPPLEEQTEIVGRLEKDIGGLEGLMQESIAAAALLLERRSALISAAVTGQIDVRGLAPEAAEQ